MKTLLVVLILFFSYNIINSQNKFKSYIPNENDCYRFIIDTTKYFSDITLDTIKDSTNTILYYKIYQSYTVKKWTKYYGYTKVWWIDFTDNKWKSKWLMGNYWKYTNMYNYYEIIFYDINKKEQSLEILTQQLNK